MKETKYYVNPEKKTAVCVITLMDGYRPMARFEGKAKCSPDDQFDEETGKEIALNRATIQMKSYLRDYKKFLRKAVARKIEELTVLNRHLAKGIERNTGEINTAKARIRELGTTK